VEQQICVLACSALGETGGIVFALLAFAWGLWQRRAKVRTDRKVDGLETERAKLESERASLEHELKVLSLRPPPALPPIVIQTVPRSSASAQYSTPAEQHGGDADPFPDESLG